MSTKPLGRKNYGSISHLLGSRLGPSEHHVHKGQNDIATVRARDKHDRIIVSEKCDGSNVGILLLNNKIYALTRAGYLASSSPHKQHHYFSDWVAHNEHRFRAVLKEGERLCGEWMMQAHSILYDLDGLEPFFVFDLMKDAYRMPWNDVVKRVHPTFQLVPMVSAGFPITPQQAFALSDALPHRKSNTFGQCGALEQVEGFVWRIERDGEFDFMAKYVRPDKIDGKYLGDHDPVWNITPEQLPRYYTR